MNAVKEKPGVMIYWEVLEMLLQMPPEDNRLLTSAIYAYARFGTEPEELPYPLNVLWPIVRSCLQRDNERYQRKRAEKVEQDAADVNKAQRTATNVNEIQRIATNVNETQRIATNVNEIQRIATNVNESQRTATNVNEIQRIATNVNECQQNQPTTTTSTTATSTTTTTTSSTSSPSPTATPSPTAAPRAARSGAGVGEAYPFFHSDKKNPQDGRAPPAGDWDVLGDECCACDDP